MADRPVSVVSRTPVQEVAAKVKRSRLAWRPAWSRLAMMRALRAMLVIPSVFALTYEGFGNLQIALFAAFGGFASLIVASFGGGRRDKLVAHRELAARLEASVRGAPGHRRQRCVRQGQERADDRVREHAVPADRAGNGRPGTG